MDRTESWARGDAARRGVSVRAREVSKVFMDGVEIWALDDVTLRVDSGEFVAVWGPSGAGKTTLLSILGMLDTPSLGQVLIDGIDVTTLRGREAADFRRATIGVAFQRGNLMGALTAVENVMLPLVPYRRGLEVDLEARARTLLYAVGLAERADYFPAQLSAAEQQRVALARAMVNEPPLLLADEPTGYLDEGARGSVLGVLDRLNRDHGTTIILTTRDRAVAEAADRMVQLQGGRLV